MTAAAAVRRVGSRLAAPAIGGKTELRDARSWAWGLVAGLVVLGPALGPGSLFTLDMVTAPDTSVGPGIWGLGPELPRATPFAELLAAVSQLLPVWLVLDVVMVGSLTLAYSGMHRRTVGSPSAVRHGAALLYGVGPFVVTRLGVGHVSMVAAMALLPWAAPHLLQPAANRRSTLLWSAALGVTGAYGGVLAGILVCSGASIDLVASLRANGLRRAVTGALGSATAYLVAQLPWLVPGAIVYLQVPSVDDSAAFPSGVASVGDGLEALAGHGFWQEVFQVGSDQPTILVAGMGVALAAVGVLGTPHARPWVRRCAGPGVLALGLVVADSTDLTRSTFDLLTSIGPLAVLREPHRFLILYLLWIVPAAASGVRHLSEVLPRPARPGIVVFPIVAALVLCAPGAWSAGGLLVRADYPDSWAEAKAIVERRPGPVLALPWARYLDISFANDRRVFHPVPVYFEGDVLVSGDIGLGGTGSERADGRSLVIDDLIPEMTSHGLVADELAELGVRWVVLLREASHARYMPMLDDVGLVRVLSRPELILLEVADWVGPAVDAGGDAVDVDVVLPPLAVMESAEPVRWSRPSTPGWFQGTEAAATTSAGLLELPGGSRVVWYWPALVAIAGHLTTTAAAVGCLVQRRRALRPSGAGRREPTGGIDSDRCDP